MTYIPRYRREIRKGTAITETDFSVFERRVNEIAGIKSELGEMFITPLAEGKAHRKLVANYYLKVGELSAFRNLRIRIEVENAIGNQKQYGPLNATMILVMEDMNRELTSILRIIVENLSNKSHIVDSGNSYMAELVFDRDLDLRNGPLSFDIRDFQAAGRLISDYNLNRYANLEERLRSAGNNETKFQSVIDFQREKEFIVKFLAERLSFRYIMDI